MLHGSVWRIAQQKRGTLGKILGGSGSSSVRAGYGRCMNMVIEGNTIGVDEPNLRKVERHSFQRDSTPRPIIGGRHDRGFSLPLHLPAAQCYGEPSESHPVQQHL